MPEIRKTQSTFYTHNQSVTSHSGQATNLSFNQFSSHSPERSLNGGNIYDNDWGAMPASKKPKVQKMAEFSKHLNLMHYDFNTGTSCAQKKKGMPTQID